jgi:hypothetical protein
MEKAKWKIERPNDPRAPMEAEVSLMLRVNDNPIILAFDEARALAADLLKAAAGTPQPKGNTTAGIRSSMER